MAFRYVDGDFPPGTLGEQRRDGLFLVTPRPAWYKSRGLIVLKGNVQSATILSSEAPGNWKEAVATKLAAAVQGQARPVCATCVLVDGRTFCAEMSLSNFRLLANEALLFNAAQRFASQDFADALIALCALVASADGRIAPAEKEKVELFVTSHSVLKVFPADELRQAFARHCEAALWSPQARGELLQIVARLRDKPDQARAVIHLGIALAEADGHFDEREKAIVQEACSAVGIYPGEFGLYYT